MMHDKEFKALAKGMGNDGDDDSDMADLYKMMAKQGKNS